EHLAGVLANERGWPRDLCWGLRQCEGNALDLVPSEQGVVQLSVEPTGPQLGIVLHAVLSALHRHGAYPGGLAFLRQGVFLQRLGPALEALIQLFLVLKAPLQGGEPGVCGPGGRANDAYEILPLLVREAGDDAPVVMAAALRAVGIMWHDGR